MEMNNKKKKIKKEMKDISQRVIIYNILPFVTIENTEDIKLKEFDLFGYFKNDRQRRIFFLFSSLRMIDDSKLMIELSEINSLSLYFTQPPSENDPRLQILQNSEKMKNLETLNIESLSTQVLNTKFIKPNSFPKLKRFFVSDYICTMKHIDEQNWNPRNEMWKRITDLSIRFSFSNRCDTVFYLPNFSEHGGLRNLKKLSLNFKYFRNGYTLVLPKIEDLMIYKCDNLNLNLKINTSQEIIKLKKFECTYNPILFRSVLVSNYLPFLEELSMKNNQIEDITYLFHNESFKKLKKLSLERISCILSNNNNRNNNNNNNFRFSKNLECLSLESFHGFDDRLLEHEYPKIKIIKLYSVNFIGNKEFPWTENIEKLEFISLSKLDFKFFRKNKFDGLSVLKFSQINFQKLKYMELRNILNIKELSFQSCQNLLESLFIDHEFSELRKLEIFGCNDFSNRYQRKWKIGSMLEEVKVFGMYRCSNWDINLFFEKLSLPKLRRLSIDVNSNSSSGKKKKLNWRFLPSLEIARFNLAGGEDKDLFSKEIRKFFPENTKILFN